MHVGLVLSHTRATSEYEDGRTKSTIRQYHNTTIVVSFLSLGPGSVPHSYPGFRILKWQRDLLSTGNVFVKVQTASRMHTASLCRKWHSSHK